MTKVDVGGQSANKFLETIVPKHYSINLNPFEKEDILYKCKSAKGAFQTSPMIQAIA